LQSRGIGGTSVRVLPQRSVQDPGILSQETTMPSTASHFAALTNSRQQARRGLQSQLAYRIAGISFGMNNNDGLRMIFDGSMQPFAVERDVCDVELQIALVDALVKPAQKPLFDSGGLWSLYAEDGGYRLNFLRAFPGETPYKSAWFNKDFSEGKLELSRLFFNTTKAIYPLEYPLDEVLMIHHLAGGKGVEVHALGLVDDAGNGHLFLGHSGAGKSTSARLWQRQPGVHILSDDRIILRRDGGQVWMHGTPWHGDAGIASPHGALLSHIYILEQAPSNELVTMPRRAATAEIFARSFVPRHSAQALDFTLQFIEQLAQELPCDVFRFVPQQSAVEGIRNARI
jgi:hypothetical protein